MFASLLALVAAISAAPQPAAETPSAPAKPPAQEQPAKPDAKTKPPKPTEPQKIERLLQFVGASGVTFIRNGAEYTATEAVEHMRRKLDYAGKRIKTARQFIKHLATGSSMTGKPYTVRFKDGREIPSAEWLTRALDRIEAGLPPEEKAPAPKKEDKAPARAPAAKQAPN